ncbi:MAG: glycosyltransferase family 2 protein [Clostridia bacterium]|nr:glycosyltransferase family 2 protein [Clostridia bacterium]
MAKYFTDMCKISVVVPVYNCERTISKCLSSILNQDFKDFELIIINDGSPDNSEEICNLFASRDDRIRYIRRENGGLAAVRNLGLSEAKGEYICFVDSDDYIEKNALSFMLGVAERENSDIVLCGYFIENGKRVESNFSLPKTLNRENINSAIVELKAKNLIDPAWNKLYKTSFLKNAAVKFPVGEYYEDTYYNLKLLRFFPKITVIKECFYHYVLQMGSITRRYNKEKLATIKSRARLLKECTSGVEPYCDFYFIKCVFSAIADMFFSLSKMEIKENIKAEISSDEFIKAAENARFSGLSSKLIILAAKSKSVNFVYLFCRCSFILKYKMQKLFSVVKNK